MLNEAYEQGQLSALAEIEKTAGAEFAEKLAGKMGFISKAKSKAGKAFGAVKHHAGKAKDAVVGYHKRGAGHLSDAKKSHKHRVFGMNIGKKSHGERAKSALKGVGHFAPHAGVAAGAGLAAHHAMKDD